MCVCAGKAAHAAQFHERHKLLDPAIRTYSSTKPNKCEAGVHILVWHVHVQAAGINLSWVSGVSRKRRNEEEPDTKDLIDECLVHTKRSEAFSTLQPLPK